MKKWPTIAKKAIPVLLALILALTLFPATAAAGASPPIPASVAPDFKLPDFLKSILPAGGAFRDNTDNYAINYDIVDGQFVPAQIQADYAVPRDNPDMRGYTDYIFTISFANTDDERTYMISQFKDVQDFVAHCEDHGTLNADDDTKDDYHEPIEAIPPSAAADGPLYYAGYTQLHHAYNNSTDDIIHYDDWNGDFTVLFADKILLELSIGDAATKDQIDTFFSALVHAIIDNYAPEMESLKPLPISGSGSSDDSGTGSSGSDSGAGTSVNPPTGNSTATVTSSIVLINGKNTSFDAYNINGNNYFKLRDLAYSLSGTSKQFDVSWDGAKNAINLISGQPYTVAGGEMASKGAGNKTASPTTSTIYLDGTQIALTAYNIDGNNYFKLRDIGTAFNFGVDWDGSNNTIVIDTTKDYTP